MQVGRPSADKPPVTTAPAPLREQPQASGLCSLHSLSQLTHRKLHELWAEIGNYSDAFTCTIMKNLGI